MNDKIELFDLGEVTVETKSVTVIATSDGLAGHYFTN